MHPIQINSKITRTILHEGREYLFFSGTAYLGIGGLDEFEALVINGIKKYGSNHGLSRINNVRLSIYEYFEGFFAEKAHAEKAVLFSSGYMAGFASVSFLKKSADTILVAPDTHPAVLPEELVPNAFQSFEDWMQDCFRICEKLPAGKVLILANAVDALKPDIHDFSWISKLNPKHEYTLLIDDSHAFGVIGNEIFGTYRKWVDLQVNLVISGSLGKGLGLPAGIILGNKNTLTAIEQQKIFRSASPPPPAFMDAFLQGQHLYQRQSETLRENINYFSKLVAGIPGFSNQTGYPVGAFANPDWVKALMDNGIIVSSFPYPTPSDPWVNRIVIAAHHEQSDIHYLVSLLKKLNGKA